MEHDFESVLRYAKESRRKHTGRLVLRGVLGATAVAALAGAMSGTAAAAPGETDTGTTTANVAVNSAIALTGATPSFTLTGLPGATVTTNGAVTFNVETNNLAGYAVTVQSQTTTMTPGVAGNTDSIPIGALSVRETDGTAFIPVSGTAPVTVDAKDTRSAQGGDALSNDYEIVIPFVNEDTYSATLDYIATTL
ncbi:hypothetical protein [Actinophytocola sp.]|uniref:hypothetical protein n=1 Tax=Actinophytocola sp. TaxID=1872138 RepID=UPI002D2D325F|nr:hypothetical protein [Actinophytocola sp.]HYQ62516.1 hypothetical protein [Actinophytocola sp.]